jgi:hypothetical protein
MRESAAQGTTAEVNGSADDYVSFSDVARAHFHWDVATEGAERTEARKEFHDKLSSFEHQSGADVVDAYWCQRQASAVALARARPPERPGFLTRMGRHLRGKDETPEFRLYRVTDWVTADVRKLADLLHDCDVLAIKAIWGLEGIPRAVVMQWLLAVEAHILGFLERDPRDEPATERGERNGGKGPGAKEPATASELELLHKRVLAELNQIEDYYQAAGTKRARLRYVRGMLVFGLPLVVLFAVLFGIGFYIFGVLSFYDEGVRTFFACMMAGAIGAIVSVVIRMSGRGKGPEFTIDHELGSAGVMELGALRPLIGAVFGIVLALLVQTFLVPVDEQELSLELFVVLAFLAGFSERWARIVLQGAMRTVSPADDNDASPAPTPQAPRPPASPQT